MRENLAQGIPEGELLLAYPQLKIDDIRAALAYAAEAPEDQQANSNSKLLLVSVIM
jgi:uncharacterized protein (DUF433 family)